MLEPLYVGIDVAKESFDVASIPAGLVLSLPNDPPGRQHLLEALQKHPVALANRGQSPISGNQKREVK